MIGRRNASASQEVALKECKEVFLVLTLVLSGTDTHKLAGDLATSWD